MEKSKVKADEIPAILKNIQDGLLARHKKFTDDNTRDAGDYDEFKKIMETTRGFIRAFWCEDAACETKIKEETKASTRCLPLDAKEEKGKCIYCNKVASHRWLFAQAY
jgi:prolyl-tRNA synthetase